LHDLYFESAYRGASLGHPISGTEKSVRSLEREEMKKFFSTHYQPSNLILSVAGDVSLADVLAGIGALRFWKGDDAPGFRSMRGTPSKAGHWKWKYASEQSHLLWGVPGLPIDHPDRYALLLMNTALGGGMSSALFQEIREKKGTGLYSVFFIFELYRFRGISGVCGYLSSQGKAVFGLD
jgi:predicted Zn-dependent peptidase